ncbi:F-box protein AUF2-like [Rhododendron vialii]|uniref:F-box protein AUF2-like n=1 Tax=Rhododendron vialii TaxID=182163 RepID=UPI00266039EE|nr:F-box protein AUF2-like [Rhododendron vialii]
MGYVDGEEEEKAENQFQRLPDDVVVDIFDKLSDIKCLCRCFMVSQRFSSLIPRVQTLSIKTQIWDFLSLSLKLSEPENPQGNGFLGKFSKFLISNLVLKPLRYLPDLTLSPCSRFNLSGVLFFRKLTQIRSLNIEIPSDFMDENDSFFKWGTNFPKLDSITVLYASCISKIMESEQEDETNNDITLEEIDRRLAVACKCVKVALLWVCILSYVVEFYPMLESFTICDSMNKGVKLCLGGEKLVECRNCFSVNKFVSLMERPNFSRRENMKVGYVSVLELPMSGYVMKGLTIMNFRICADDDSEAGKAMVDAFVEEQSVFSEAMVQIWENRKDGIKAMFLYGSNTVAHTTFTWLFYLFRGTICIICNEVEKKKAHYQVEKVEFFPLYSREENPMIGND